MFDVHLPGVCDKIVPDYWSALEFAICLLCLFLQAPCLAAWQIKKSRIRQLYAKANRAQRAAGVWVRILSQCRHCTFYGTANSNQMMVEIMGLHLPGSSFINPYTPCAMNWQSGCQTGFEIYGAGNDFRPVDIWSTKKRLWTPSLVCWQRVDRPTHHPLGRHCACSGYHH